MSFQVSRFNEETFKRETVEVPINVGDGVSYGINGDAYPMTVRKVSPSGKTVWCSRDEFRGSSDNSYAVAEKKGVFVPRDEDQPKAWEKFTQRQDGTFRRSGSKCCYLFPGRTYRQDPHF